MNYIVLEGVSLFLFLILIIFLLIVSVGCLICTVLSDRRGFILGNLLSREKEKVRILIMENFVLRIKCGEFDIDEK